MKHADRDAPGQLLLLPGSLRRVAIVIAVGCAAITVLIGVLVTHRRHPDVLDKAIDFLIRNSIGKSPGTLNPLASIGSPVAVALLAAALVVACLVMRHWSGAVLVAVGTLAASAVSEFVLRPLVANHLGGPHSGGHSFPSGHATGMFALETALAVLLVSAPYLNVPQRLRLVLAEAGLALAVAVPVAMVGLYHHYFSDIVGGAAVGTGIVLLTALALDSLARQRAQIPPNPPQTRRSRARHRTRHHGKAMTDPCSYRRFLERPDHFEGRAFLAGAVARAWPRPRESTLGRATRRSSQRGTPASGWGRAVSSACRAEASCR